MISPEYVVTMARYNKWQNTNLVQSVDQLTASDRAKDMGGFFGSIEQTCFHVVWGDSISRWAGRVTQSQLDAELRYYSGAVGREINKPMGLLVTHFFNHQTHHRGQVHAMLTALGVETQDTDMPLLPDEII